MKLIRIIATFLSCQISPCLLAAPESASEALAIDAIAVGAAGSSVHHIEAIGNDVWIAARNPGSSARVIYKVTKDQVGIESPLLVVGEKADLSQDVIDLMLDCKGNLWIAMEEIGIRVVNLASGRSSTLINKDTTDGWLTKYTTYDLASRCLGDEGVEVWLGRIGVKTLRYQGDYPVIGEMSLLAPDQDPLHKASAGFSYEVTELLYSEKHGKLIFESRQNLVIVDPETGEKSFEASLPLSVIGFQIVGDDLYVADRLGSGNTFYRLNLNHLKDIVRFPENPLYSFSFITQSFRANDDFFYSLDFNGKSYDFLAYDMKNKSARKFNLNGAVTNPLSNPILLENSMLVVHIDEYLPNGDDVGASLFQGRLLSIPLPR